VIKGERDFMINTQCRQNDKIGNARVVASLVSAVTSGQSRRRLLILRVLVLAAIASLWAFAANAQSYTIYTQPKFLFNAPNLSTNYRDTLDEAWQDVQSALNSCSVVSGGSTCSQVLNLHPFTTGATGVMLEMRTDPLTDGMLMASSGIRTKRRACVIPTGSRDLISTTPPI